MGVRFLKASALQLPRARVTSCEFQEKPAEVTTFAKSQLAMQYCTFSLPISEQAFLNIGVWGTTALYILEKHSIVVCAGNT